MRSTLAQMGVVMATKAPKRTRVLLWLGAITSPIASYYSFWAAIFYSWMNANGSWSAERAAMWAYPCLALSVIFAASFIWCVCKLTRN